MEKWKPQIEVLVGVFLKGLLLFFILVGCGYAANNSCGISCSQIIANNSAISAINQAIIYTNNATANTLSQANTYTDNAAASTLTQANTYTDNAINTRVYEKVIIFAENAASIVGAGATAWAFGDGDTGAIGVPVVEDWELYAVSFQARSVTLSTNVTMTVRDMNTVTTLYQFTAPLNVTPPSANGFYTQVLTTPVAIPAGTTIDFVTSSVSAGVVTGARIAVWLRRHPD